MKVKENPGVFILAIYLIVSGIISFVNLYVPVLSNLLPLVALSAGLLFLIGTGKLPKSLGIILLGVWLILKGLLPFIYVPFPYFAYITDCIAIAAGIFILTR